MSRISRMNHLENRHLHPVTLNLLEYLIYKMYDSVTWSDWDQMKQEYFLTALKTFLEDILREFQGEKELKLFQDGSQEIDRPGLYLWGYLWGGKDWSTHDYIKNKLSQVLPDRIPDIIHELVGYLEHLPDDYTQLIDYGRTVKFKYEPMSIHYTKIQPHGDGTTSQSDFDPVIGY